MPDKATFALVWVVVLGLFFPLKSVSQIQGAVKDSLNQPIAFANVVLLNRNDSSVVSGVMATETGTFSITSFKQGPYIIGVRMLGYKSAFSQPFVVKDDREHYHIDPIILEVENHSLQDVNVVAKKSIYELQIDRMVVNVENSITSSGNTALQVLEKSPGVVVNRQNNTISMAGKSGVMVIINGKQNRMPLEAAVQMLDGMSADNVKRIELITNPPAKYDAEGDAGIINIVLKKHEDFGTNGSFNLGGGIAEREKMNASFNINHHVEKVNYYATYSANFNNTRQKMISYRRSYEQDWILENEAINNRAAILLFHNLRMGMDYTISSKTTLGVLVSGYVRDWEMDALSKIIYTRNQLQEKQTNLETFEISKWIHGMGNINLRHHFKEEEILDFNIDYLNYYNKNPSIYKVEHLDASGQPTYNENIDVKKVTPIDILVGAVDYTNQLSPAFKLEAGVKGTLTYFQNDVGVSYFNGGSWSDDPELTGKYTMNESIGAAFLSLSLNLGTGTSIAGGLRYEYLNSVLDSEQEKGIIDLNYGRVFPTLYLSQKLNKSNTVQFSYSKRIDRPTFNELAPFIIFVTPETYISGNEKLLPAFSNILKMDYQVKSVIFTISHTATTDAIARFQPKMSEDNTKQYYISRNLDKSSTLSLVLAFPITITEWWKMQNNLNWLRQNVTTEYESLALNITQDYYQINTNQSFTFTKTLSGEISGFYRSKFLSGVGIAKPLARVDMGAQWKVSENSRFNLNVTDAFKTSIFRGVADIPELNIYSRWELDFEPRVYRLTFTHNFGNAALKVRKRDSASEEEKSRITQ
jgi:hypothetical protein